jgi:hypothetical protein
LVEWIPVPWLHGESRTSRCYEADTERREKREERKEERGKRKKKRRGAALAPGPRADCTLTHLTPTLFPRLFHLPLDRLLHL